MKDIIKKLNNWLSPDKQYNIVETKNSFVVKIKKEADMKSTWTKDQQHYLDEKFNDLDSKMPKWFSEFATNLNQRLDKIDARLEKIENTPTMKKELSNK